VVAVTHSGWGVCASCGESVVSAVSMCSIPSEGTDGSTPSEGVFGQCLFGHLSTALSLSLCLLFRTCLSKGRRGSC